MQSEASTSPASPKRRYVERKDGSVEMIRIKAKQRRRQKGAVLVLALIVMALASLAVAGLLYYVNTSLIAHGKAVDRMEARYAADAGMDWFIAELTADSAVTDRSDATGNGQEGDDIWPGGTVNGLTPTVTIDSIPVNDATSKTYQVTATTTTGDATIEAEITQVIIGGSVAVGVVHWNTTY